MTFSFTKEIIDSVKLYPILYNPEHVDYSDIKKREEAWDEIGKKLNHDGDYLKLRWNNLKLFYEKHLKSLKAAGPENRCRRWPWTRKMEFFKPYLNLSPAEATNPIAFEHVTVISDNKGEIENNTSFFNENEDVTYDCYETDLQNQTEAKPTKEIITNFCDDVINKKEMDTTTLDDVINETEMDTTALSISKEEIATDMIVVKEDDVGDVADECREVVLQDAREERHAQEKKSESHPSGLDDFMSYLGNTENNQMIFNDDAIDLLFLGLAECVKTFSSKRQAITKLKLANIILEQELEQRKDDLNSSLSLNESSTS